eukprot:763997-Hanusia_phi.AAC.1
MRGGEGRGGEGTGREGSESTGVMMGSTKREGHREELEVAMSDHVEQVEAEQVEIEHRDTCSPRQPDVLPISRAQHELLRPTPLLQHLPPPLPFPLLPSPAPPPLPAYSSHHVPTNGMAKLAVYIRCSMKGWTDPEIASVTNDA